MMRRKWMRGIAALCIGAFLSSSVQVFAEEYTERPGAILGGAASIWCQSPPGRCQKGTDSSMWIWTITETVRLSGSRRTALTITVR